MLSRLNHSLASRGLSRTVLDLAGHALHLASRAATYTAEADHAFDRRYGTDTAGKVDSTALGYDDQGRQKQAILYLPSPERVTRWMLENIGIPHADFSFIDLGCGKGRVVLGAAQYPFKRVLGVDLSRALTEVAERNVSIFPSTARKCDDVQILNVDATTIDYPNTNLLLHLYHPFDSDVTSAVLHNLAASLAEKPRRAVVAYLVYSSAVPEVRAAFARFPWLKETRYESSLLGHYDWLFFEN